MRLAFCLLLLVNGAFAQQEDEDLFAAAITREKTAAQQAAASARSAPPGQRPVFEQKRAGHVANIVTLGEKAPKSPVVNLEATKALTEVDEPAKAKPFAEKAVELAPKSPEARVARGNVSFALGDYRASAQDARTALALDPKNEAAKGLLRFSESRLADMAARVKLPAKRFSGEQPQEQGAPGALSASASPLPIASRDVAAAQRAKAGEALQEAHAKLKLGDPEAAARLGRKASLLAPGSAEVRAEAAYLRLKSGDSAGALEEARLASALEAKPRAEVLLLLAAAQYASGDAASGRGTLSRAASLARPLEPLARLALGGASPELERAIAAELSARFTPSYDAALSGLGDGAPRPAEGAAPGARPSPPPPDPLARTVRAALSAAGMLLVVGAGALWLKARRSVS